MNKVKRFFKNILISFLIFYIIIANTSSSYARNFDDAARAFLAEQTEQFINEHSGDSVYSLTVLPAAFRGSTFYSCCTSGVAYVYNAFLGLNIYNLGFSDLSDTDMTSLKSPYWTEVSFENSKPGDILVRYGHVEMVAEAGNASHFNFGSGRTNANLNIHPGRSGEFLKVFSLNEDVQVTPTGELPAVNNQLEEEDNATEDPSDEFYYLGTPQQGSFAGTNTTTLGDIANWLFNLISQLVDYVAGFMTMMIKMVVIGWANVLVNIVTDAVDAITGEAVDTSSNQTNTTTNANTSEDNTQPQTILDSDELYTPSSTELQPEGNDKLTIDKIIFNQVPLLDVNMFTDTAAGYTLKDDSSLKIIRESVSTWYYIIRNVTIVVMLVILIYVGIKMAISSIASERAEYKRMLVSWLVGFIIIFIIHYFLILVLDINSTVLGWITNAQQNLGYEDSIYETVRTKAYEIKFSSGMVGTILYIILILYMLKFLYIYIKRLLAVCILTIMAPVMGASYAISKVRTGKARAFTRWMKDYALIVLIQSVHALIYTCFVTVVLQLTNESVAGIIMALIVMNFILKATDIFTSIFGMVGNGNDGGSRSLKTILGSDPKRDISPKVVFGLGAIETIGSAVPNAIKFGKNLKSVPATQKRAKQLAQAQGLGMGNLGKKAIGQGWLGIKNIDAATGQYIPSKTPEKISSLSDDLAREEKATQQNRKDRRKKLRSELYSAQKENYGDALNLATAIPLMGVSGFAGLGAANLISVGANAYARNIKKARKNKGKPHKYSAPVRFVGGIAGGPITGTVNNFKDTRDEAKKKGGKIQTAYESRLSQINDARTAESNIIGLYTSGRRNKEEELKGIQKSGKDGKLISAMAKTSFDDSYRRTIDNVFEVSDIVDNTLSGESDEVKRYRSNIIVAKENDDGEIEYKSLGSNVIGRHGIDSIKEQIRQKASNNISEKIRDKYKRSTSGDLDEATEQKIKEETEQRVSMFMRDLDKEISDKVDTRDADPTVIRGGELDFSESIKADKLKSTIEDVMKKHNADKKAEEGMQELQEEMQRLQRIDRDYANSKANKEHTYLYRFGTDITSNNDLRDEKSSSLKNVLSSLTLRNIDINGEGE